MRFGDGPEYDSFVQTACTGYEGGVSHGPPDFAKLGHAYRPER